MEAGGPRMARRLKPRCEAASSVARTMLTSGIETRRSTASKTMCGMLAANAAYSAPARTRRSSSSNKIVGEAIEFAAPDQVEDALQIDAVDEDRRIASIRLPLAIQTDDRAVVVDRRFRTRAADDAESFHAPLGGDPVDLDEKVRRPRWIVQETIPSQSSRTRIAGISFQLSRGGRHHSRPHVHGGNLDIVVTDCGGAVTDAWDLRSCRESSAGAKALQGNRALQLVARARRRGRSRRGQTAARLTGGEFGRAQDRPRAPCR